MQARTTIPVGPPISKPLPSYWQDPKSPLANLVEPEADSGTQPYEYAIIGSGITGTMIAYNILKRRPNSRVVMLEAREVCSGATGRNGGHTKAASYRSYVQNVEVLGKEEALRIARLEYVNIVETHEMARELGIQCESEFCRTVDVIYGWGVFEEGKRAIEALRADAKEEERAEGKMAWYQIHEPTDEALEKFHVARTNTNSEIDDKEDVAGFFEYMAGRIHAYRFTTGILKECVKKGLQIMTNTPVHALQPSQTTPASWHVYTQFNTITAQHVILATNGYTPYLLKETQSAIVPMRGQITAQRAGPNSKLPSPLTTTYSFIYKGGYEYMIPRNTSAGQDLIIGGGLGVLGATTPSEYGTVNDGSLNPKISSYLLESLAGYFGASNWGEDTPSERVVQEWSGIMGATADGRPFVGEVPGKKGVWVCAGFNGHGMVLCAKSAEAVVGMVVGEGRLEWFPESFLVGGGRLRRGGEGGM